MGTTISVISIAIGIGLMVILCFAKFKTLPATILAALVVGLLSQLSIGEIFDLYQEGAMNAVSGFFLLTAFGGMFGILMERSGAASKIVGVLVSKIGNKGTIFALSILFALMNSYGGMGAGAAFMMAPLFLQLLQRMDLPRNMLAGLVYSAMGGYCICYPGTVSSINLMPMEILGTTPTAGGVLNWVLLPCGIFLTLGYWYVAFKIAKKRGSHFVALPGDEEALTRGISESAMSLGRAFLPMILLVGLLNFTSLNTYLSFIISIVFGFIVFWKYLPADKQEVLNSGFMSATVVFNIMAAVGLGTVLKGTIGFTAIQNFAQNFTSGNPYWNLWVSGNLITGTLASGGGSIGLMANTIAQDAIAAGCNVGAVHRIICVISQAFDTLPHNGTTCMILGVCGLTHKDGYFHMFMTSLVIPFILSIIAVLVAIVVYPVAL